MKRTKSLALLKFNKFKISRLDYIRGGDDGEDSGKKSQRPTCPKGDTNTKP